MYGSGYFDPAANPHYYDFDPAVYPPGYAQTAQPPLMTAPLAAGTSMTGPASMSSMVVTSTDSKSKPENSTAKVLVMLCASLFFLISVAIILLLLLGGAFSDTITEAKDPGRLSESGSPGIPSNPMVVEVPVVATDPSTTTATEPGTTASPRPKALGTEALLCTYGKRTRANEVMAEDGLCDYAFYDSLYQNGENSIVDRRRYGQDFRTFMRAAGRYTQTALGLAFCFLEMPQATADLQQTRPNPLEEFWRMKIFHVGVLDTTQNARKPQMQEAIALLKMLHDMAFSRGHRSLSALAGPIPKNDWAAFVAEEGRNLRYYPDMFIVHGHYNFGDNTCDPCAVMPPTRYSLIDMPNVFSNDYDYNLTSAPVSLREPEFKNAPIRGLVSVTMKGRWTSPSVGEPFEFYSHCDTNRVARSFGIYTEVCRDSNYAPNLQYKRDHYAVLTHHSSRRRAFAYDNEEGLGAKLCKVKGDVLDVSFGIAAFDVDFEDYVNECSSLNKFGNHSRLKALRKIVDYYKTLANDGFNEASCTSVIG